MRVPPEPSFDFLPAHGLVAGNDVLDVAGQQVTVVWQTVSKRGAVVENELILTVDACVALFDRLTEGVVFVPVSKNVFF